MRKTKREDIGETPTTATLLSVAHERARSRGHEPGRWTKTADHGLHARCTRCDRVVSVRPNDYQKDGRGFGGTAITFPCDAGPRRELPGKSAEPAKTHNRRATRGNKKEVTMTTATTTKKTVAKKAPKGKAKSKASTRAATKKPAAKAKREPKAKAESTGTRGDSIMAFVVEQLKAGADVAKIAAGVMKKFPDSKPGRDEATAKKHVAWYRWKARKLGLVK